MKVFSPNVRQGQRFLITNGVVKPNQNIKMLGVICATDREFALIKEDCNQLNKKTFFGCDYFSGELKNKKLQITITKCGVGKCDRIVFIGTAGALTDKTLPGDVVVSTGSVQHDFDGRPFIEKCTVFSVGEKVIKSDETLQKTCRSAAERFLAQNSFSEQVREKFQLPNYEKESPEAHVFSGIIASGDQFIASPEARKKVLDDANEALCCEMEGAAVAQACFLGKIPHCIVRVISDRADGSAYVDFNAFCDEVAGILTHGILKEIIKEISE